jgi:hypothetical protein
MSKNNVFGTHFRVSCCLRFILLPAQASSLRLACAVQVWSTKICTQPQTADALFVFFRWQKLPAIRKIGLILMNQPVLVKRIMRLICDCIARVVLMALPWRTLVSQNVEFGASRLTLRRLVIGLLRQGQHPKIHIGHIL